MASHTFSFNYKQFRNFPHGAITTTQHIDTTANKTKKVGLWIPLIVPPVNSFLNVKRIRAKFSFNDIAALPHQNIIQCSLIFYSKLPNIYVLFHDNVSNYQVRLMTILLVLIQFIFVLILIVVHVHILFHRVDIVF